MKNIYRIVSLFALIITLYVPVTTHAQQSDIDTSNTQACAILENNLKYGARDIVTNSDVSMLQDFLNTRGYLSSQPSGFFGRMTFVAVQSFQSANGISPTGFVGPVTRAKIKEIDCLSAPVTPVTKPVTIEKPYIPVAPQPYQVTNFPKTAPVSLADKVSYPEHGATYMVGQTVPIAWNLSGAINVDVSLIDKNGQIVSQIASNLPSVGSYNWVAQSLFSGNFETYRINVSPIQQSGVLASSLQSDFFSIVAINPPLPLFAQSTNYNNFGNDAPDTYLNPRVNFGGQDVITYNDDSTATQWCKMFKGKTYNSGKSYTNWANPQDGMHYRYDGSRWIQESSGDYPRYYVCSVN